MSKKHRARWCLTMTLSGSDLVIIFPLDGQENSNVRVPKRKQKMVKVAEYADLLACGLRLTLFGLSHGKIL